MTTNIKDCKAFIDNGKIKIVDDKGVEYDDLIARQKKKANTSFYFATLFFAFFITFLAITLSTLFFTNLSKGQVTIFTLLDVVSLATFLCFMNKKSNYETLYQDNNYEYNLTKNYLQPRIMELQKELCTHETEVQNIKNQGKFDFKKSIEMVT